MTPPPDAAAPTRRRGPRAARREDVTARILEIGRAHLTEHGAAGLSLRAVTRDLGMVSSAVYRYVANRDELLTLLVVDAYSELGDAVDAALVGARGGFATRMLVLAGALHTWAVAEPARWALLYGSPVPGYQAPGEVTLEPGTRVMLRLVELVDDAIGAGEVPLGGGSVPLPRPLAKDLAAIRGEFGASRVDDAVLARGLFLWTSLVGLVSAEVFGQLGPDTFTAPELAFEHQVRLALTVVTTGA